MAHRRQRECLKIGPIQGWDFVIRSSGRIRFDDLGDRSRELTRETAGVTRDDRIDADDAAGEREHPAGAARRQSIVDRDRQGMVLLHLHVHLLPARQQRRQGPWPADHFPLQFHRGRLG